MHGDPPPGFAVNPPMKRRKRAICRLMPWRRIAAHQTPGNQIRPCGVTSFYAVPRIPVGLRPGGGFFLMQVCWGDMRFHAVGGRHELDAATLSFHHSLAGPR